MLLKMDEAVGGYFQVVQHQLWKRRNLPDQTSESLILLCTERTKLADRQTWEWFFVPNTKDELIVQVHVSVLDAQDHEITSNTISLPSFCMPGFSDAGFRTEQKTLILSPYLVLGSNDIQCLLGTDAVVTLTSRVPTSDLTRIKSIRCKVNAQ